MQKHAFVLLLDGWSQSNTVPIATIGMLHLLKIRKSRHVHILMNSKNGISEYHRLIFSMAILLSMLLKFIKDKNTTTKLSIM
jgi:hypothetical protein